tara:strand:- start:124 stop:678 length:555 start_codon:yes stop_codon:yes gene_type:complete
MTRIPQVDHTNVNQDLLDIFKELANDPDGIGTGPMSVLKHSPEMAKRAIPLFEYVRNESSVPFKLRELAMLVTGRTMDCPYIWNRHVGIARETDLTNELIDSIRDRRNLPQIPEDESIIINYCSDLMNKKKVTEDLFEKTLSLLGRQGLVELNTLIGFYTMLAFNANSVELDLPDDISEPPLPV